MGKWEDVTESKVGTPRVTLFAKDLASHQDQPMSNGVGNVQLITSGCIPQELREVVPREVLGDAANLHLETD